MWTNVLQAALAVLGFVVFPFAVITAAAGVLTFMDRLTHLHHHHHHHHRHA